MSSDYYWMVYKWFHNPPGTPQNLRCINCRHTVAAGAFTLAGISAIATAKVVNPKPYLGMSLAVACFIFFSSGTIALRMATEDQKYNDMRSRDHANELRKLRKEQSSDTSNQQQQHA